jgi:hypothetical protein
MDAGAATATAPNNAPLPDPASRAALSYLKTVSPERCEWIRQPLPAGAPTTLLAFDAPCGRARLSWSPKGKEGLVFSSPQSEGAPPRIWRVDFTTKTGKPLELKGLPDKSSLGRVGFDAQGNLVALVAVESSRVEKGKGKERFITFEGQRYPVTQTEGKPGLALAYRMEGADWKRFETKVSAFGEDAPGLGVLEASKAIPQQTPTLFGELPGQKASESAARMLDAAIPGLEESGRWMSLSTPGGTLHYRGALDYEEDTFYPSTPVRWEQDAKLVELEGLPVKNGTSLDLRTRDELLLIFVVGEQPRSAHVFDTRTKKNLLSVKGIDSPTLWPVPAKP